MSVYKKNGKWYYKCQVFGVRKHGLCRGASDRSQALECEAEIKNDIALIHRGKKDKAETITLSEMLKEFMEYSETNNSEHQFIQNKHKVKIFKEFFGEDAKIVDITPLDIEKLKQSLIKKGLKNSSVNRYYSSLCKAFNLIIINKRLNMLNPCKMVSKLKEDNEILRYLTEDEEERLMKELSEHLRPIVVCALTTGLRLSNILNLKWEAINLDMGFLEVLKQDNKGHKKIQIPLSAKFKFELEKIGIKQKGYVFINPDTGKPYTTIKTGFNKALERAGIENFRFHDLRHTVGTRLVSKGADLLTVKEYLAHSNLATTQRYMHPIKENMKKAVDILDNF